jgi:peptide/nickel transport system substrate-binding protein
MSLYLQSQTRRQLLQRLSMGAGVLTVPGLLSACSRGEEGSSDQEAQQQESAELRRGGQLVVGVDALSGNADPGTFATFGDWMVIDCVGRGLTFVDYRSTEPQPALAERWEISNDGRTYRFQLRQGLTFHDGNPVTAQDCQRTFARLYDEDDPSRPENVYAIAELGGANFRRARAVSDSELEITLRAPDVAFLSRLSNPNGAIISEAAIEEHGDRIGQNLVGAGPFRLQRSEANQSATLEAFPDFYAGRPLLDRVVFQVLPDPTSLTSALRQGSAQLSPFVPFSNVQVLNRGGDVNVAQGKPYIVVFTQVNARSGILRDINVRRAVSLALDRDAIVEQAFGGEAQRATGLITPPELGHSREPLPYGTYDVEQARQLIREAGAEGESLRVNIRNIGFWPRIGQIVDQNLRAIGLRPNTQYADEATVGERDFDPDGHDISVNQRSAFVPDPDNKLTPLIAGDSAVAQQVTRHTDLSPMGRLDRMLTEARQETDEQRRAQMYQEIERFFAEEFSVMFPMAYIALPIGANTSIGGVNVDALGTYRTFFERTGFVA